MLRHLFILTPLFFTSHLLATEFTFIHSHPGFTEILSLKTSASQIVLEKNSNLDDLHKFAIGKFKTISNSNDLNVKLDEIATQLKVADEILKDSDLTYNTLNKTPVHGPHFEINKLQVYPGHKAYRELQALKAEYLNLEWTKTEGVELQKNKIPADCKIFQGLKQCPFKKWGSIFIEDKQI